MMKARILNPEQTELQTQLRRDLRVSRGGGRVYTQAHAYYSLFKIGSQSWKIIYKLPKRSLTSSRQEGPASSEFRLFFPIWALFDTSANTLQSTIARHCKPHVPEHQSCYSPAKRRRLCTLIAHRKVEHRGWKSFEHTLTRPRTGSCATSAGRDPTRCEHDRRCAECRTNRAPPQGGTSRCAHTTTTQYASCECQASAAGI
jgi:hypothetical protein